MSAARATRKETLDTALDIAIRITVVGLIVYWCLFILRPFLIPMIWGIIIAVALGPLFNRLVGLLGGKRGLAAAVFTLVALFLIIYPTFKTVESVLETSLGYAQDLREGTVTVPPPNESVRGWPVVGPRLYAAWAEASANLQGALEHFQPQVRALGAWLLARVSGLAGAILQTVLALIIAGFMLTYAASGRRAAESLGARFGGERGKGVVQLTTTTIGSVFRGILGVAIIQAGVAAIGLVLMGVPAWGVWTLGVLFLAILQLPPILILGPICVWVFNTDASTVAAIIFTIFSIAVNFSDPVLKAMLLGRGTTTPMPVILLGAIGGMVVYGLIGLFVGAVVLAIGYELLLAWLSDEPTPGELAATVGSGAA